MNPTRKLIILFSILFIILLIGTIGFVLIEGDKDWNLLDSFYFTLITLTTIGYGETHNLSRSGRIFTIFLIFFGVGTTYYIITTTAQIILEGHLRNYFWRKRMTKSIDKLRGHYIICGYGRIGSYVCDELYRIGIPFVIIENGKIEELERIGYLFIQGDASNDQVLLEAGIMNARALVIAVGNDPDSVFITLSARDIRKDIYILARFEQLGSDKKLMKAGANKVISPHLVSGGRMLQLLLKPTVTDFLDLATSPVMIELTFEEIKIKQDSKYIGLTLEQSALRKDFGVIVVGIQDKELVMKFNPSPNTTINEDDVIIVLGNFEQINKLKKLENPVI